MAGSYYSEFEKWLETSQEDEDVKVEDAGTSSDDTTDFFEEPSWHKKVARSRHESAPILVDDDDEIYPHDNKQFEDEPPVLEPAPNHNGKVGVDRSQVYPKAAPTKDGMKSYSRQQKFTKSYSLPERKNPLKTYSSRKKSPSQDSKITKETGNIFEKFTAVSDHEDDPPPLIPSSGIVDSSMSQPSPDFVAMEADSTSEILGQGPRARRLSKNSMHGDVSVECDSTCMLGGSPQIVSPAASNSEGEVRDQGGGGIEGSPATHSSDGSSPHYVPISQAITPSSQENPQISTLALPSAQSVQINKSHINSSISKHPYAPSEDKDSPPMLCVIPVGPKDAKKRHSIDSPDTFSPSGKRPRTIPSPQGFDEPPAIPYVSELIPPNDQKLQCVSRSKSHSRHAQRRQRHQSTPTMATLKVSGVEHLPKSLQTFAEETVRLSGLQCSMHQLICTLFPALRPELEQMSPECPRFESFLSELVMTLQQGSSHSTTSQHDSCRTANHSSFTASEMADSQYSTEHISEDIIPQFSNLCLSDSVKKRFGLRRVSVCLHEEVESKLWSFAQLSCDALQLLLPELTVSLCNELTQDTEQLQVFIENVIMANSKDKRKH